MARSVRVILFNADEEFNAPIRTLLLENDGVRIVAEVDEPALMVQAVAQFPAEVLVAHLDPNPAVTLTLLTEVIAAQPQISVFAVTESTDAQLILSVMRSGIREFITKPVDPEALAVALAKVAERSVETASQGKLITVIGSAGGVGATTVAINLAVELRDLTQSEVGLVDLDYRFGQVATFLDADPSYTIADLCGTPEQIEPQVVERALTRHPSGVRVLARPTHFAQAEGITAAHCVGVLSTLLGTCEYVVVDGPTRFDLGAKAVIDMADTNLLVLQLLVPSVRNSARMLEAMRQAGFNLGRSKLVYNRVRRDGGSLSTSDVNTTLQLEDFATIPDEWVTVSEAINLGEPLLTYSPKSKVRASLRELAERLHGGNEPTDEKSDGKAGRGLLSKILTG